MAETPRHVRAVNSSRSFGVGSFGNAPSIVEESDFDTEARARLNGKHAFDDSSPRFEDWSPEKQRASYEGLQRADEKRTISSQNADEFLLLNPHILDTKKNAGLITKMLSNMFGDIPYTVEHYDAATQALLVADVLDIDKAEVAKQQQKAADAQRKAALKNRADAAARVFNPSANYENMSLDELRNRANQELSVGGQQEGANGF